MQTSPKENCLYLGRNTTIKSSAELVLHADTAGKEEIKIATEEPGITMKKVGNDYVYNTNKT